MYDELYGMYRRLYFGFGQCAAAPIGVEAAPAQPAAETQAASVDEGTVSKLKKKLLGMFGG